MGPANYIPTKIKNGDNGLACEFKDGDYKCKAIVYQLSWSDRPIGISLTTVQPMQRTIRYKCGNGHRFDVMAKFNLDKLAPQSQTKGNTLTNEGDK